MQMKRFGVVVALGATLVAAGSIGVAHASGVVCEQQVTLTFSPPLSLTSQSGTGTIGNDFTCVDATTGQMWSHPNEFELTYAGTCQRATLAYSGDWAAVLVNGSLLLQVSGSLIGTGAAVVTPDQVCNESSATGPAITGYVGN